MYLRYQPNFIWPKSSFIVQLPSQDIAQKYFQEDSPLISAIIENTECNLSLLTLNEQTPSIIKIAGGAGIDKEVIRLTIEEILQRNVFSTKLF